MNLEPVEFQVYLQSTFYQYLQLLKSRLIASSAIAEV